MPATTAKKTVLKKKKTKKITLDDLKAIVADIAKAHRETEKAHQETEKALRESHNELEKSHKELQVSLDETSKTLNKAINGLSNTLGSLVEHIMTPGLPGKFRQFGFTFNRVTTIKYAVEGSIYAQIDGLLENGEQAMVVEVKTTLRHEDIDEHLERMEKVRAYADAHGDRREFLGAIAATITDESTRKYALKNGFFVIEPSGEDVKITQPPVNPRVW